MNYIDFSHLGGMPVTQDRLNFLQQSYNAGFNALAKLCGDKTILEGVENTAGTVSDGWIVVAGEILPFIGGSAAAQVVIVETPTPYTYADGSSHNVEFTRHATLGAIGAFPFSDLVPLLSLKHVWKKDDLRQCVKDNAYIAANFDVDGYGTSAAEKGWRIFSAAYANAAGKVLVNRDAVDSDFDEAGKFGGAKTHTLGTNEQGSFTVSKKHDDGFGTAGGGYAGEVDTQFNGIDVPPGGANASTWGTPLTVELSAATNGHNNLQPYFVVLTLIKL